MSLRGHNSGTESAFELFKCSKDSANLQVCNEKNFLVLGFGIVIDVTSGVVLGLFGPLHLALGSNH